MFHDPYTDVSEARQPTSAQREVLELLGVTTTSALVRLPLSDWRRVKNVVDALAQARQRPAAIPRPRTGAGSPDGGSTDVHYLVGQVA